MIGRVLKRGDDLAGLLRYLFGPGRHNEHVNPHLVAAWGHPTHLEPPIDENGRPDVQRLAALLNVPLRLARGKIPDQSVWHCMMRAAPGDPDLGDGEWMPITQELMHRVGLSVRGHEDEGVRWVAVHHGDNHIHIVAVLARMDGAPVRLRGDYYRVAEAMRWAEKEFGLVPVVRATPPGTAPRRPTRAEAEKARRAGRSVPPRTELRRRVEAAAAAARSEQEFFTGVTARGVQVRRRYSTLRPDDVTGYAVALPGDITATSRPVWFGGGKLAADLTLPRLRRRWIVGPGRLSGRAMSGSIARLTLAREALRAARVARTEPEFFDQLGIQGLLVRFRSDPDRPGQAVGYSVTLPGLVDRAGQPIWFGGGTLDAALRLGELRSRWRAGRPGAAPDSNVFAGASLGQVYAHAATVAQQAAAEISTARSGRADIAWAAADLLTAAAETTGSPELRRAAEGLSRAARAPWGRIPAPSPAGAMLRTAAYLLAGCTPVRQRTAARRALIIALAGLAHPVARLRAIQQRKLQADAALRAATHLAAIGGPTWGADSPASAVAAMTRSSGTRIATPAAPRSTRPGRT